MANVLLKRNYNTPFGRFRQSRDGIPTPIPDIVLERMAKREMAGLTKEQIEAGVKKGHVFGLPSDAVIVGADYKTPAQRSVEDAINSVPLTAAEQEAEINRKANEIAEAKIAEELQKRNEQTAKAAEEAAKADAAADEDADADLEDADEDADEDAGEDADTDPEAAGEDILDLPISEIIPLLGDLDYDELKDLLEREQGGKTRKTLVVEIESALAEFE